MSDGKAWRAPDSAGGIMVACRCERCCREHNIVQDESGLPWTAVSMLLCPECGNKRCPKASDHRCACTGSNEPSQVGTNLAEERDRLRKALELLVALKDFKSAARTDADVEEYKLRKPQAWAAAREALKGVGS